MPFNIYPDATTSALLGTTANTPVPLAAGAQFSGGVFVPLAMNFGPDPAEFNLTTSFIRISMSGAASAAPPQIELQARNPTQGTTGSSQIISAMAFPGQSLTDGFDATDAASAYFLPPYANNVYLLKVVIEIAGTILSIRITNNTAANRDFVWVVADSDANSQQPWIQVSPASLPYSAPRETRQQLRTAQPLLINNRGTGTLTVSNIVPALAAPYAVNSGLPAIVPPNPAAARQRGHRIQCSRYNRLDRGHQLQCGRRYRRCIRHRPQQRIQP